MVSSVPLTIACGLGRVKTRRIGSRQTSERGISGRVNLRRRDVVVCHATRGFATKSQRLTIRCSQATFPISVLRNNFQDGSIEDYVEAYIGRSTHPVGVRLGRIGRGAAGRRRLPPDAPSGVDRTVGGVAPANSRVRQARAARNPRDLAAYPSLLCQGHSILAADD